MARFEIHQFPCLSDNFGVLLHDPETGETASIDAPDARAVQRALDETGWGLTHILTTHHHNDHTSGNETLKARTGCRIVGPAAEARRIPGLDQGLAEADEVRVGGIRLRVLETPGHTAGHISYHAPDAGLAFVGDTLFSLGCGKLLEGDARMMWTSLQKLAGLPKETAIYCGHEYTLSNARFALGVEPGNTALEERAEQVRELREARRPTLPTSIGRELATNPFLRTESPEIRAKLGMADEEAWRVFGELRARKDRG